MKTRPTQKVQSLPLQFFLIVPFVLQIFGAVGLVGYLSFRNGQKAVNDMANQLIDKAGQQVNDRLDSYLALPHQINQLNANVITANQLDLNSPTAMEQHFWRQIQVFKDISYTGITLSSGRESGAGQSIQGKGLIVYEKPPGNTKGFDYLVDQQGKRIKLLQSYEIGDSFLLPSYSGSVKAGKPIWSQISAIPLESEQSTAEGNAEKANTNLDNQYYIAATAARPVYDSNGKLRAVLATDLLLSSVNQFLHNVKVSSSGQVFIFDRDGLLVGSSTNSPILHKVKDSTERWNVLENPDPLIHNVSQSLQQQFGDFRSIQTERDLVASLNGQNQFIQVAPWRDKYGLDWLVVVVVPESDFMAQINTNTRTTIWLCFAALGVAVVLGVLTARWIAHPILWLNQASEAIAAGDLGQQIQVGAIRELNHLAESFNHMASQVKETFTALEKSNEALEKSNEELEDRVEARTQELKNTLQELRTTQTQMVQSEKMSALGQMVAGVAHEINNPVNFIHGNLTHVDTYIQDLLRLVNSYQKYFPDLPSGLQAELEETDLPFLIEDLAKILQSMHVGTGRIRQIVLSLRNFSRLDEADIKPVDIHEGLDNTLVILAHRLKAKSNRAAIEIIKNYGDLPAVECYAGQLNQVFMNILANAIDAMEEVWMTDDSSQDPSRKISKTCIQETNNSPQGARKLGEKPTLIIYTKVIRPNWIQIAIADNGSGIPESIQQRLFDPFFTTKPVGKGTGMGLSISYQIITEKHNGKLFCVSSAGKGTEFLIEIPIKQM